MSHINPDAADPAAATSLSSSVVGQARHPCAVGACRLQPPHKDEGEESQKALLGKNLAVENFIPNTRIPIKTPNKQLLPLRGQKESSFSSRG